MIDERDQMVIAEYKNIIEIAYHRISNLNTRWDVQKNVHDLLKELKNMPYSNFFPLDYAFEDKMEHLLEWDEDYKNTKLTDDIKKWVIREAHNTFDNDEWEYHVKRAIHYTLQYYEEPEYLKD